jgi:Zn-dependent protease
MKWSFRVARVSGIDVRVHATFALAVLYFALAFASADGPRGAAFGVLLVFSLFVCLTLHEFGHGLMAQRLGVSVNEILLLPIGGVARLASEPRKPQHELWIALAGPLVNAVIALVIFFALGRARVPLDPSDLGELAEPSLLGLARALFWGNVVLGLFNMLPALPMDGGRVFRALLSLVIGRSRATRIASAVGQVIAVCLVGIAFKKDWGPLGLVGLFVFIGAAPERAAGRGQRPVEPHREQPLPHQPAILGAGRQLLAHVAALLPVDTVQLVEAAFEQ